MLGNATTTKKVATISIIALLLVALGLFIWAVATQRFEIRRKAVSGEPGCVQMNPGVTLVPTFGQGIPGQSLNFDAVITNNDTGPCTATTFNVYVNLPANWQYSSSSSQATINPSDATTVHFSVTSPTQNYILGNQTIEAGVTTSDGTARTTLAHFTYELALTLSSPSPTPTATPVATTSPNTICNRGYQSLTLTPSTAKAHRGEGLNYTVTLKNNDEEACGISNFNLSAILPYSNWTAKFDKTTLTVAAQKQATTVVTITSSANSPYGNLPIGVNSAGPKSAVVGAANYEVLQGTAGPKASASPEVIYLNGGTGNSPLASASATPYATTQPLASQEETTGQTKGILSQVPTAVLYAIGGFLLIVLFFILRALFGGSKDNPPKMTPPTSTPTPSEPAVPETEQPSQYGTPQISHSVEAPMNN